MTTGVTFYLANEEVTRDKTNAAIKVRQAVLALNRELAEAHRLGLRVILQAAQSAPPHAHKTYQAEIYEQIPF